ncbi:hypothetical protein Ple7327_0342 [Pleurocapsa sp. PCC 7327]|nr:hypothetical protein [Pleurocapsa sp. PCC 7327]AFY75806.1 hypothetical protein Ple7327_0342 [Pleurocapsa sp. PCC 7327]
MTTAPVSGANFALSQEEETFSEKAIASDTKVHQNNSCVVGRIRN